MQGVGFDKQHILSMSSKAIQAQTENEKKAAEGAAGSDDESSAPAMNKLGAVNVQDLKYLDQ